MDPEDEEDLRGQILEVLKESPNPVSARYVWAQIDDSDIPLKDVVLVMERMQDEFLLVGSPVKLYTLA